MKNNTNNVETYLGLTADEMEKLFKKINCYGLNLLEESIYAWQNDHHENGELLKGSYDKALATREVVDRDNETTQAVKKAVLRKSLKRISEDELKFMEDLLELEPCEVDKSFSMDGYYEINSYVIDEGNRRKYNAIKKARQTKKLTP